MFKWLEKRRKYAAYWEAPSKEIKERGIAQDWLGSIGESAGYDARTLKSVDDQWPDCEIKDFSGALCGIEITEIVDSVAVHENQKGNDVYRMWSAEEIIEAIQHRLKAKDLKFHGGKYKKLVVLMHADELEISYDQYHEAITKHIFCGLKNIDEAYFIYSYIYGKYPVTKLNVKAYKNFNLTRRVNAPRKLNGR